MDNNYKQYLATKSQYEGNSGFEPLFLPDFLFPFQKELVQWSLLKGRSAIFADCGLGKTPMQLVWAQNIVEKTAKPVLILTPLSVGAQTKREGIKFGIECDQSRNGKIVSPITITNYQQLHKFNWQDFGGIVCDESSILKNFDGQIKSQITEFMRKLPYRLLCTATAAPNDYIELGTSSEALGIMGYIDMLKMFFKSNDNSYAQSGGSSGGSRRFNKNPLGGKFRFRGHAEKDFWRWVCSWARAIRQPSDMGFSNDSFVLPSLTSTEYVVKARIPREDMLFDLPAISLQEQRSERRRTLNERCELAADKLSSTKASSIAWCYLNDEGHLLEKLVPGSVNIEGSDSEEYQEEIFESFISGEVRVLITKPIIAGFGLNWQHCSHMTFFPSYSFEQWYQAVRRCWRFGQQNTVHIDMITSEGESGALSALNRKSAASDVLFSQLVELMKQELNIHDIDKHIKRQEDPSWL